MGYHSIAVILSCVGLTHLIILTWPGSFFFEPELFVGYPVEIPPLCSAMCHRHVVASSIMRWNVDGLQAKPAKVLHLLTYPWAQLEVKNTRFVEDLKSVGTLHQVLRLKETRWPLERRSTRSKVNPEAAWKATHSWGRWLTLGLEAGPKSLGTQEGMWNGGLNSRDCLRA